VSTPGTVHKPSDFGMPNQQIPQTWIQSVAGAREKGFPELLLIAPAGSTNSSIFFVMVFGGRYSPARVALSNLAQALARCRPSTVARGNGDFFGPYEELRELRRYPLLATHGVIGS
jgi:hypothetical protein